MDNEKVMTFDETLDECYRPLFGEITEKDVFQLRDIADVVSINDSSIVHEKGHRRAIDFIPSVVMDVGANIGIFSRYARSLFPHALIVAVEPDDANCETFVKLTSDRKTILHRAAIGTGRVYRVDGAINGAHEVYLSESPGYDKKSLTGERMKPSFVQSMFLHELRKYVHPGDRVVLKMDIEGSETIVFDDPESMSFLKTIDYFIIELHYYSADAESNVKVVEITNKAMADIGETHVTMLKDNYFYALKKWYKN